MPDFGERVVWFEIQFSSLWLGLWIVEDVCMRVGESLDESVGVDVVVDDGVDVGLAPSYWLSPSTFTQLVCSDTLHQMSYIIILYHISYFCYTIHQFSNIIIMYHMSTTPYINYHTL